MSSSRLTAAALVLSVALTVAARSAAPVFFPDDPITRDDDRALDAGRARPIEPSDFYDFIENTFFTPGEESRVKAVNVNTIDEVPDSSWFTNRIGVRAMPDDEIVRGPDRFDTLSVDGWPIVEGKSEGLQPGFRLRDPKDGHLYQIEFDPPSNPEMATGAELIGTAFYHAFGYNVVDVYLVEFDPERAPIAPTATIKDIGGAERRLLPVDVEEVLRSAARLPNGRYRALASRFADGRPLGNFRYYGTRADDPNDIFPHEHRRELRANRVFAAWLNHDDSRGVNSLDMLEGEPGRQWVKHYMFDFGSILGSGTAFAQTPRAGNEYILDWKEGFVTLLTLGLYVRPWLLIDYPDVPASVGRFEAEAFDPERWKAEYPNPAFRNLREDDAYWGARIVSKFSDETIRRIVEKARYSDPRATDFITRTLIARRDKVLRAWLTKVLPVDGFALSPDGTLTFENTAVNARLAAPPPQYLLSWFRFDNATGQHEASGPEVVLKTPQATMPAPLADAAYVGIALRAVTRDFPEWRRQTRVYFRKSDAGWHVVGMERLGELPGGRR
ncbi:MAG TPA: hypothetical protein VK886_15020 [Vicinamibacterales bacterium]|nr:hypothetical protein [Vicinamibacterales bacterium]